MLSVDKEPVIIVFRSYAILPLGHCLYAPQPTIPIPRARRCTAAIGATLADLYLRAVFGKGRSGWP